MKRNMLVYASLALMTMASGLFAVEADIDGATPGKWTMDLDAAKKVAAEKSLPILLDFSGSDWCGWCKLMETNVFMKAEWKAYATNSIMMVLIDFPNDKSLVPEKYAERNSELNTQYGIEGFPTFIVLDSDGETELGRLGAGREKTPESFMGEVKQVLLNSAAEVEKFKASLSPEKKGAYEVLTDTLSEMKQLLDEQMKIIQSANMKVEKITQSIENVEAKIQYFRLEQRLSAEELKAYKELKDQADAATKKLEDWIATSPERNDENMKLYQEMVSEIQTLEAQLSKY